MSKRSIAQVAPAAPAPTELPLEDWHVVFTGFFEIKPRIELEKKLRSRGVRVSPSIREMTTHLILGKGSGMGPYGNYTGVGGCKHHSAVALGVAIVGEEEVWNLIHTTSALQPWYLRKLKGRKTKKAAWCSSHAIGLSNATPLQEGATDLNHTVSEIQETKEEEDIFEAEQEVEVDNGTDVVKTAKKEGDEMVVLDSQSNKEKAEEHG